MSDIELIGQVVLFFVFLACKIAQFWLVLCYQFLSQAVRSIALVNLGGTLNFSLLSLISNLILWSIILGASVTLIFILISVFNYITFSGEAQKLEGARTIITNGVFGLITIAAAFTLWGLLVTLLSLTQISSLNIPEGYEVPIAALMYIAFLLLFIPLSAITLSYVRKRSKEKIIRQIRETEKDLFESIEGPYIDKMSTDNAE